MKEKSIIKDVILNPENLLCFFIILSPILDMVSFIFRNYFQITWSPSTIIRPIIPIMVFIILFFKENNKLKKVGITIIYALYSIIHLVIFQKLQNGSSYGNIKDEIQYIINYSFLIINLFLFYDTFKQKDKVIKSVFITGIIYIVSIFISIITKTASTTYLEGIGVKGWFESGNSLCTVLLLITVMCLSTLNTKDWKKILLIGAIGIYLVIFSQMRTGVFGFSIIIGIYILSKFFLSLKANKNINKAKIISATTIVILILITIFGAGANSLQRRKELKENAKNNIDEETGEIRFVTGDILNIYKKIKQGEINEEYMTKEEQQAIIVLCETAEKVNLSNVNLRMQQLIYNIALVKEQKNIGLILFGNGYKNQTGELVMEMEVPAFLLNFGIIGFTLYFMPFLIILIYSFIKGIKNIKNINIEYIMFFVGCSLAMALSVLSGYVYFNLSSMTMTILLNVLLLLEVKKLQEQTSVKK